MTYNQSDVMTQSGIFSELKRANLEQNLVTSVVGLIFWFIKLPYKVTKHSLFFMYKIVTEFFDAFIVLSL